MLDYDGDKGFCKDLIGLRKVEGSGIGLQNQADRDLVKGKGLN